MTNSYQLGELNPPPTLLTCWNYFCICCSHKSVLTSGEWTWSTIFHFSTKPLSTVFSTWVLGQASNTINWWRSWKYYTTTFEISTCYMGKHFHITIIIIRRQMGGQGHSSIRLPASQCVRLQHVCNPQSHSHRGRPGQFCPENPHLSKCRRSTTNDQGSNFLKIICVVCFWFNVLCREDSL